MQTSSPVYERLKDGLYTSFIGKQVITYKCISSTQDMAISLTEREKENVHGLVVIAETQKKGRGRMNREWISPYGGIWLSMVICEPKIQASNIGLLPLVAALAVCETIEEKTGLICKLKWPNDVLINGKKVSGILLDAATEHGRLVYAIIGIGINANIDSIKTTSASSNKEECMTITSLKKELSGKSVNRKRFTQMLLERFEKGYIKFEKHSLEVTLNKLREKLDIIGSWITVNHLDVSFSGLAIDIDHSGCLLVKTHANFIKKVFSDNVSVRKMPFL